MQNLGSINIDGSEHCAPARAREFRGSALGGWRVKLGRAVRLELERSAWLGEGPGQPGSLHLRYGVCVSNGRVKVMMERECALLWRLGTRRSTYPRVSLVWGDGGREAGGGGRTRPVGTRLWETHIAETVTP